MKIYNASGAEILDIQVDDSSVRYRSIMNDDSLTLNFSSTGPVSVPRGSYVDFEGARYTLFYPENFKKNNTRDFSYTLVLHGWREALKLYKYKDLSSKPYRLKFPLTARPVDFLQLLVDCMNLHDSGWTVGDYIEADEKLISFNHEYCFDVLNRLAQEFNTEWEIAGKTIHLRKVEKFKDDPLPLSYGMGNGFKTGVGRQNDGDRQPIGRLYVQGGERNIDYSEYGSSSLLLPKSASLVYEGKTYRTDADGMYITRDGNTNTAEDSYDGADHYPKRVGTVSHVIVVDAAQHFYDIRDTSIPAALDYRDCRIPGEKATIIFQSGALAGREFDIEQTDTDLTGYIHAERRFKIVPAELDGQIMPGGVFVPQVGDKYAIFNISMPQAYISDNATKTGASWDMFREVVKYFAEEENDKFSFTGELDGVWSKSRWLEIGGKIVPGGHVLFSDPQFQPSGILIRITAVKDYVNKPHKPEIILSNAPISGSFSADLGKLEAEEVVREADKKEVIRFTKRQWRDAKETMSMLQEALLNFSGSINPITVQTMQLLVGDESLQFRFVNNKTNPSPVTHNVSFNPTTKVLTATAGIIQHMTIGITSLKKSHAASEYKYWDMAAYTSPALDADKAYYLYARCAKSGTTGVFLLSETAIGMESVTGQYHFLVGILNSEQSGDRSFAPVYGFSEILPGRITTDRIVSQDGKTYFDLLNGIIGGHIKFLSSGSETDLENWSESVTGDIQDAQQSASEADQKAQQAIDAAAANVTDYNAKFAAQQAQIDGVVDNWFYPYSPTLANYPASEWTTSELKDRHIGDTFTNTQPSPATDAGKSWRFVKNGSVYSWTQIADSDAVKALQQAAQAQATADGKSTTFLVQPSNYHLGDTWVLNADRTVNGTAYKQGEILTATQDSTTFVEAHWVKRVRYTDDTAVNNLKIGDVNLARYSGAGYYLNSAGVLSGIYSDDRSKSSVVTEGGVSAVRVLNGGVLRLASVTGLTAGKTYTWRIMIKGATDLTGLFQHYAGSGYGSTSVTITEDWAVYTNTFVCQGIYEILHIYSLSDTFYIADWMLVEGNKVTEGWSVNILDVEAKINAAKQEALTAAGNAQSSANAAQTAVDNLDDYMGGAFRDGVIDAAEAKAIEKSINILNSTMSEAEASYNKVYANTYLEGTAKTNLLNAKINLWGQRDTLLSAINTAISGGSTTPAQKTAYDNAFATFNSLMLAFQNAIEEANKAIQVKLDQLSTDRVNNLQIGGRNYFPISKLAVYSAYATVKEKGTDYFEITKVGSTELVAIGLPTAYIAANLNKRIIITGYFYINGQPVTTSGGTLTAYRTSLFYSINSATGFIKNILSPNTSQWLIHTNFRRDGIAMVPGDVLRVEKLMVEVVESGNLSSDHRIADEDVQAGVDNAAAIAADAQAKANTSKAITDNFTSIEGGLITSTMIQLRPTTIAPITAGMSAIQGSDNELPAFWSGGTYAQAIAGTAKAIDRHDGSGQRAGGALKWDAAGNTEFTGKITAPTGKIGEWNIVSGKLTAAYGSGAGISISESGGRFLEIQTSSDSSAVMSIRNDDGMALRLYTQAVTGLALSINAQTGGAAIRSAGGHYFMQRSGEKWTAPGVLGSGMFTWTSTVITAEKTWSVEGVSFYTSNRSGNNFRLVHNLGHTDYVCFPNAVGSNAHIRVLNRTTSYVEFEVISFGSDQQFFLLLTGRNVVV